MITILFFTGTATAFAQLVQEKIIYIIDSVPLLSEPDEVYGDIRPGDIQQMTIITNKDSIRMLGFENADKLAYIQTIAYLNRPDSLRSLPDIRRMEMKNEIWYDKGATTPYSGPFADYYINGKPRGKGFLQNGQLEGRRVMYFTDGKLELVRHYAAGIREGEEREYHPNGQLMQQGMFSKGKKTGLWQFWYSSGKLKLAIQFKQDEPRPDKDQKKTYDAFEKGLALAKQRELEAAIRQFTKAIESNDGHADIYYHRGTAYLNILEFDKAISDFDHAIELEPLYHQALAFRGMARIRKHELGGARRLAGNSEVSVLTGKKTPLPEDIRALVCADLRKSIALGNTYDPVQEAAAEYCK
jgi:antitoxin component YwqK of YwqJK toxin-antitoxin module